MIDKLICSILPMLLIAGPGPLAADDPSGPADASFEPRLKAERRAKEDYFRDHSWSPLRAFERFDFPKQPDLAAVVGSSADVDVRLEAPGIELRQMTIEVVPPASATQPFHFRLTNLAGKAAPVVDGEPLGAAGSDAAIRVFPEETVVTIGPFAVRPYVQGGAGILILFDSRRTAADRFVPPHYFPIDRSWRFRARLIPSRVPEELALETSLGRTKRYRRVGHFDLPIDGATVRIFAYQPTFVANAEGALTILFSDRTSGRESYGAGRYLDLDPPVDDIYTIDFNRAYSPFCSYTDVYNCPIPPRENRLKVAVGAGEKSYPHHVK